MLAGQEIFGSSSSVTITSNEHMAVWPARSVTLKVLVVVPFGKSEPEARPAICTVTEPGQLSVPAGAVYITLAVHRLVFSSRRMLAGLECDWSSDVCSSEPNEHMAVWPARSVTLKVLVVVPFGKS